MLGKINRLKDNCDDKFIYPLTVSKAVYVNETQNLQSKLSELDQQFSGFSFEDIMDIDFSDVNERGIVSFQNGAWKVVPDITNSYLLELEKWDVSNEGNDAANTSEKLNEAIQWASQNGYDEFVLPNGVYLIDEQNPLIIPSRMTFNLGGSKLRIQDNGLERYSVILIENKSEFIRITNGEIEGDRYNHDFETVPGTHEWGMGITVEHHSRFIHIDFLHIYNVTGDCVYTEAQPNFYNMSAFDYWEQGSLNIADGSLIDDVSRIRSIDFIDLPDAAISEYGFFNVCGNSFGDFGRDIRSETFDVVFYDDNNDFVDVLTRVKVFDDIEVPDGAASIKLSLYQGTLPTDEEGTALSLCVSLSPRYVYIENCNLHHARRCGIVPTGKHLFISGNKIHHISGASPGCAIDVEDGYGLNQNIRIYNNHLYETRIGVAFVSTQHVYFYGNYMERLGPSTVWGECRQVHINDNIINGSSWDLQGEALFNGNTMFHSSVSSRRSARHLISDNYFYNSSLSLSKDLPFTSLIDANYFYRDLNNTSSADGQNDLQLTGSPQIIQNNHLDEARFYNYSDQNGWMMTNNHFKLIPGTLTVTIAPGLYRECYFDCSALDSPLQFRVNSTGYKYEFKDCIFNETQFFASYDQPMDILRFDQCEINTTQNRFVYFRDMNGILEFTNNRFNMNPISENPESIISLLTSSFTSSEKILLKGNTFTSYGVSMQVIPLSEYPVPDFQIRDNTLENTTIDPNNSHLILSNNLINGIKDPYFIVSTEPTSGYFRYRQKLEEADLEPGGYIGWICIHEGTANETSWQASTVYSLEEMVNYNGNVYKAIDAGTSSTTAPSHTSGSAVDGGVTWEFVSEKAIFKQYGLIAE
ncbi:hypothetical protein LF817_01780 [Halobacillus sp. A1]|uniref:hypothetical protein n=1 Tax=Halobacillus sp. A1 TaxID=2880262 RepID=UPI0020A6CFD5|nr:hypothetical protein [Halobacillus sp. A1]MCP3030064.1 hypothetical protein [Halobacillus sp. A1]